MNHKASILKCAFSSIFLASFHLVIDNAFLIILTITHDNANDLLLTSPSAYYTLCYGAKLVELFAIILIHAWAKRHFYSQVTTWTDWLRLLFFPFSTLIIALYLTSILFEEPHLADKLLYCTITLLISDLVSILLLDYLEKQQKENLNNTVLLQNLKLESEHVSALKDAFDTQRKLTHDFQNQLSVLQSMAERHASQDDFVQYLNQILATATPSTASINTHRLVVDIVLNQKTSVAKNKSIVFQQNLDNLADFLLPDDALVVVLTNLIDNAIEACAQIPDPMQRRILLKMHVKSDGSYLYIENTTSGPVQIRNNYITTTKRNPIAHGYGLKNVYAMLDRQNALYAIDYQPDDSVFCFSAKIST